MNRGLRTERNAARLARVSSASRCLDIEISGLSLSYDAPIAGARITSRRLSPVYPSPALGEARHFEGVED